MLAILTIPGRFASPAAAVVWGACLLPIAAVAQSARPPISGTYVCVDAKGTALSSDRPIPACADREQRVLSPSGVVRARILPPQTPAQRAEAEARQRAEADARAQDLESRRLERALLMRFPNEQAHTRERSEALVRVQTAVDLANQRISSLQGDQRKLDEQMEFYRKDPSKAPAPLRAQQADISRGLEEQQRLIVGQQAERMRVEQRFDEELQRLRLLWTGAR